MIPRHEIDTALRNQHLPNLSLEDQCLFAARARGWPAADIADRLGFAANTVHRKLERLQDAIFVPLGIKHDPWATGLWCAYHATCCLALATQMIEGGQLFPPAD
jgi:hypothetical protein